jgi:NAD-dependent deacetylase
MTNPKLIVLTGAGISAESGISTFRDSGGLWEQYRIEDVATPEAFDNNPSLVLEFYNQRRAQLDKVEPNEGHKTLARLEQYFDVHIITQNVDNLHERAGSTKVLHLHGELTKVRSARNESLIYEIGTKAIKIGDKADDGAQLRPHIVWFGEAVPAIEEAIEITTKADIFVVIGTSLNVYPAAGLVGYAPKNTPKFIIDPNQVPVPHYLNFTFIQKSAGAGSVELEKILLAKFHIQ